MKFNNNKIEINLTWPCSTANQDRFIPALLILLMSYFAFFPKLEAKTSSVASSSDNLTQGAEKLDLSSKPISYQDAKNMAKVGFTGAGGQIQTVILLGLLGASSEFANSLKNYSHTGDGDLRFAALKYQDSYFGLWKLAKDAIIQTGSAPDLWMQIAGSRIVEHSLHQLVITPSGVIEHALKFVGFFGWEFGREWYQLTLEDFHARMASQGQGQKKILGNNIFYLARDPMALEAFVSSMIYVLGNRGNLRKMFILSLNRWASFDMLGTYASLTLGGSVGRAIGQKAGADLTAWIGDKLIGSSNKMMAEALLRQAGGRMALARVVGSIAGAGLGSGGPLGAVVGSIVGVIAFVLIKDLTPIQQFLEELDANFVVTSTLKSNLFYLQYNMRFIEKFVGHDHDPKLSSTSIPLRNSWHHFKYFYEGALSEHFNLVARPLHNVIGLTRRYFQVGFDQGLRLRILLAQVDMSEETLKNAQLAAIDGIVENSNALISLERALEQLDNFSEKQWQIYRQRIINYPHSQGKDLSHHEYIVWKKFRDYLINEDITRDVMSLLLKSEIKMLQNQNPLLMVGVRDDSENEGEGEGEGEVVVLRPLYKWHLTSSEPIEKNKIIFQAAKILQKNLIITRKIVEGWADLQAKVTASGTYSDEQKRAWLSNGDDELHQSISDFIEQSLALQKFLDWMEEYFATKKYQSPFALEMQGQFTQNQLAVKNLFNWQENYYQFMEQKIYFLVNPKNAAYDNNDFMGRFSYFQSTKTAASEQLQLRVDDLLMEIILREWQSQTPLWQTMDELSKNASLTAYYNENEERIRMSLLNSPER